MSNLRARIHNLKVRLAGSVSKAAFPSAGAIYGHATDQDASTRNPVVVIPGILGSRLRQRPTGKVLWGGKNKADFADPTDPEQLRAISFPVDPAGSPLRERDNDVYPDGSLDRIHARVLGLPLELQAYGPILQMLGVGGFLLGNQSSGKRIVLDYSHRSIANCFEFAYDWRRSIPDNAARLARFIDGVLEFATYDAGGKARQNLRVDIVAHSMAGLMLRYFLRYGGQPLPPDDACPVVTWAGVGKVEHAILVGTPNAGSLSALDKLINGLPESPATPFYDSAILSTMPGIYQLLPRPRHKPFIHAQTGQPIDDLLTFECWQRNRWGLADPQCEPILERLLPSLKDPADRRRAAHHHLELCLNEARRFFQAMDLPAIVPNSVGKHLFAGDGVLTPSLAKVGPGRGSYKVVERDFGDGTVLRSSALMDERRGHDTKAPRVITPIRWEAVTFVPADHMMLTRHPSFVNNALYILLEKTRPGTFYDQNNPPEHVPESSTEIQ
jgi:hypothetical protein